MKYNNPITRTAVCILSCTLLMALLSLTAGHPASAAQPRPTPRPRSTQQIPTPRARPTPIATPIAAANPSAALSGCASDIFGLKLTYTKSGGLTSTTARTLTIPTQSRGTISATIDAGTTAVYGLTNNSGVQTLAYGSGSGNGEKSIDVSQGSLCYLQFTRTQTLPTDADSALALLKQTFPGVPQKAAYTTKTITGGYVFTISTNRPGTDGQVNAQAIALMVIGTSKKGQIVLSATSGIGSFSASVPTA